MRYLAQRILFYLITAWAAITANFFIPRLIPGNPVEAVLGRFQGQISTKAMASLTVLFGLNKHQSLWQQYVD
jgi:peptide/nickel transport system permease protein